MTDKNKLDTLSNNFNLLADRIAEDWALLTNSQVMEIERLKEQAWLVVCRRGKRSG